MSNRRMDDIPEGEFGDDGDGPPIALILAGVIAVLALIFVIQNSEKVQTDFLFFSVETRQWVAIVVAIVLGVVLDRLFSIWWRRSRDDDD
ncbi:LapA family protein [Ilumatobacter nonamiensis]|uniref:LapA family protein n=1 Tax=Ilumatobacter nonamiensis TaxID=467093 RepID=UPI0011D27E3A|nr:LapA family protein [Ilumatobacter nonamiensis]